jgi:hypothetical protein
MITGADNLVISNPVADIEGPDGAQRGYFATDADAETNCN